MDFLATVAGKAAAAAAGVAAKPITQKVLDVVKMKFLIGKQIPDEESYPIADQPDTCVYAAFIVSLNNSFHDNTQDTIAKLLECTEHHEEFIQYFTSQNTVIIEKLKTEGVEYAEESYMKLLHDFVDSAYEPCNLAKWQEILGESRTEVFHAQRENQIYDIVQEVDARTRRFEEKLDKQNSAETMPEPETTPTIQDNNEYYEKQYKETLFMEDDPFFSEGCTDEIVTLEEVFVEPVMDFKGKDCDLIKKLQEWVSSSNRKKRGGNAKIFLLYGQPGGGKSSLTSHILCENYFGENCHAARLNQHLDAMNHIDPWQSVKDCFNCQDDSCYTGTILILDGFDEVCVLKKRFQGHVFINNLKNTVPDGVKILITSREYKGYFQEVKADNDLLIGTVKWTDGKLREWCNKYSSVHKCRTDWCNEFPEKFDALGYSLKDALGTPIILYICCVRDIDISQHNSIAGIYEDAFRDICLREYNKRGDTTHANEHRLYWQYTKEIAFQMFVNDTLSTAQADDPVDAEKTLIKKAQEKTYEICKETIPDLPESQELNLQLKRCFGVFPFIAPKGTGIEFAHKTVGEYFTAVKLFEDYFGKLFPNGDKTDDEKVWTTIFQAFRYNNVPEDIINYLVEITDKRLEKAEWTDRDLSAEDRKRIWRERLFRSFHEGMAGQYWWKCLGKVEPDYTPRLDLLNTQVELTFANFSWYLTKLGFAEYDRENYEYSGAFAKVIGSYLPRNPNFMLNFENWKCLQEIFAYNASLLFLMLRGTDLRGADLRGADLYKADLRYSNLKDADLSDADLSDADLGDAYLRGADLRGANLRGANLISADLEYTKLEKIHLYESDLPKWDESLKEANSHLIDPIVHDDKTDEIIFDRKYNPETNRMDLPAD